MSKKDLSEKISNRVDVYEESLELHKKNKGKIEIASKVPLDNRRDLSLAYTPGVAEACREIVRNPEAVWDVTSRGNWVAVVTDGSAVLGLGDIGAEASLPVMEGKCALFKKFAGIDAFPIALKTRDIDTFIQTVKELSTSFGAINLEDISAPRCFEIEERLKKELDIPVMHDDQHGTATVVVAGLINALKITGRTFETSKILVNGAGAAGVAIVTALVSFGAKNILVVDSQGIISRDRADLTPIKKKLLAMTEVSDVRGSLVDGIRGKDVFIGVSVAGALTGEMVKTMAPDPIIFALSNPTPEIMPDIAKEAGAKVVATGRSDFPNQVNNVLAYPGVYRGALNIRARKITDEMLRAATVALASCVAEPTPDYVIPDVFDTRVVETIARAVSEASVAT